MGNSNVILGNFAKKIFRYKGILNIYNKKHMSGLLITVGDKKPTKKLLSYFPSLENIHISPSEVPLTGEESYSKYFDALNYANLLKANQEVEKNELYSHVYFYITDFLTENIAVPALPSSLERSTLYTAEYLVEETPFKSIVLPTYKFFATNSLTFNVIGSLTGRLFEQMNPYEWKDRPEDDTYLKGNLFNFLGMMNIQIKRVDAI